MQQIVSASKMYVYAKSFMDAYVSVMEPLSEELDMPQSAVDILMFLANNPGLETAKDICRYRYMKPGIVSFHVDRLVEEKYLERSQDPTDRRKYKLLCTERASRIIERGRETQRKFAMRMAEGLCQEDLEQFSKCLAVFSANIEQIKRDGLH